MPGPINMVPVLFLGVDHRGGGPSWLLPPFFRIEAF